MLHTSTINDIANDMLDAFAVGGETGAQNVLDVAVDRHAYERGDAQWITEHAMCAYRRLQG
jgi:hypothetical protein